MQNLRHLLSRVTTSGKYLPLVDGLRFLAIAPVIIQHASERLLRHTPLEFATPVKEDPLVFLASRGTIGVFIFFALSGFMLSIPFARHKLEGAKKPALKSYFFRRFTRIEPPYLIWMSVFALVLLAKGASSLSELAPHWLASCFYLHNFAYGEYSTINPVAWSLEIEIQFYLLAPWLVQLFFSIKNASLRQGVLVGSIFGFVTLQHAFGWQYFPWKASLLGQFQHFLVGIWLADCYLTYWKNPSQRDDFLEKIFVKNFLQKIISLHRPWLRDVLFVPALLVMAYTWTEEYLKSIVFALAMMYVLAAAFRGRFFHQFFQNQWVAIFGGMCYTIYLIHLPLLELQMNFTKNLVLTNQYLPNLLLQLAIAMPLILLASAVFFVLIEKPFMRPLKLRLPVRLPQANGAFQVQKIPALAWASFSKIKKSALLLLLAICLSVPAFGQAKTAETEAFSLPPLDSLIEWALKKSPVLRSQDVWIATQKQAWKLEKKSWANLISVGGTALLGTNNVLDYHETATNSEYISVDRKSAVYNAGISVRLTLGDVINRSDKANIKRLEWERAQVDKQALENQIREEVMVRYDRLQADLRLLELEAENVDAMRLALEMAQKAFENGDLPVSEYSTVLSKHIAAQKLLEEGKLAAQHSYRMLREIVGMNF